MLYDNVTYFPSVYVTCGYHTSPSANLIYYFMNHVWLLTTKGRDISKGFKTNR